jgi:flagellin FlaB
MVSNGISNGKFPDFLEKYIYQRVHVLFVGVVEGSIAFARCRKMKKVFRNEDGFTGLEAAIVLIAFVVVAAVFSYVVLGAGFFTTQKSQETVYKGVEQATANIQMVGQMYGLNSAAGTVTNINAIKFTIGLAPGAPAVDLEKMTILFSTTDQGPSILNHGTTAATDTFTTTDVNGVAVVSMKAQDQVTIDFLVTPVPKNTVMNIELRPAVGAALPFSRTTPPKLEHTNILY